MRSNDDFDGHKKSSANVGLPLGNINYRQPVTNILKYLEFIKVHCRGLQKRFISQIRYGFNFIYVNSVTSDDSSDRKLYSDNII